MIVTKAPTQTMIRAGAHMSAGAYNLLGKYLVADGFSSDDFVFVSSVRCAYDKTRYTTQEKKEIEQHCRQWLLQTIEHYDPELIIPLGADAAKAVYGRSVKITKVRGVPEYNRDRECYVLPMEDPARAVTYPQHEPIFASDCKTLTRLIDHDFDMESAEKEVLGDYQFVDDLQFLIDENPEWLSFDCETLGVRPYQKGHKILTMQFCTEPGKGYMLVWDHPERPMPRRMRGKIIKQLRQILQNPDTSVVGQNLKYDASCVLAHFGFRFRIDHDTLMLAAILDENSMTKDLDTLTKLYVPEMAGYADSFNSKYDKSRMDLVPLNEMLGYGVGDVDASLRVLFAQLDLLEEDDRLWTHYRRISIPGINAFTGIEQRGMIVDEDALDVLEEELAVVVEEQRVSLMKQVHRNIKRKHLTDPKMKNKKPNEILSFSRSAFVLDILFYSKDGYRLRPKVFTKTTQNLDPERRVPSISSKDHLPFFFDECPFTEELAQYVKDERILSTNVRSFREKYLYGGKIHPVYSLWTAVTGRTASRDPNGQNFPKRGKVAKAYRNIFIAPPGYVILEADLSQAELRISADMANDRTMLDIYNRDGDIHALTAASTMGMSFDVFMAGKGSDELLMDVANNWPGSGTYLNSISSRDARKKATVGDFVDFKRFQAKAINFGFIYGMGWRKFIIYAKTQYGVEFSEKEAQEIRATFFRTYGSLEAWHRGTREFVHEHGYVRSYSGRVRHLPMIHSEEQGVVAEAERQAINSPVQEFGSSLGVMSIGRIDQEVDPQYLAPIGFVHDAIYCLVPLEYIEWGAKTLKYYMESNPIEEWFGRKMKCPIKADVGFGIKGGVTHEMGGLELDKPYDFTKIKEKADFRIPKQKTPPRNGRIKVPEHMVIYH